MDKEQQSNKQKLIRGHEIVILISVFILGIFIGSLVIAGPPTKTSTQCSDGIDNDGDNRIDYPNDPGCSSKRDDSELNSNVQCDDGIDNDGDTKRDLADPGCASLLDTSERGTTQCDDGLDNDNDGKIDYPNDPGCTDPSDNNESDILSSGESGIIQVTTNTGSQRDPRIYGNKIVWNDKRNGANDYDVYMYDITTKQETRLTSTGNQYNPDISGTLVVYVDQGDSYFAPRNVTVLDLSTGQKTKIASVNFTQPNPAISGNKVVWQDYRNGNDDIYLYDLSTGQETRITSNSAFQGWPDIDGNIVVWQDLRNDDPNTQPAEYDAYMYDLSTGIETRLTPTAGSITPPKISGDRVVTVESAKMYVYTISTGQRTQILLDPASLPNLGNINSNKIVYYDFRNTNSDIYMYDLFTGQEIRITTHPYNQYNPSVYGNTVVWEDIRTGNDDIFMKIV